MKTLQYRLISVPTPEGGYTVKVSAMRGRITYGETIEEAIAMAKDAIEGCLDVLMEEGRWVHSAYSAYIVKRQELIRLSWIGIDFVFNGRKRIYKPLPAVRSS